MKKIKNTVGKKHIYGMGHGHPKVANLGARSFFFFHTVFNSKHYKHKKDVNWLLLGHHRVV